MRMSTENNHISARKRHTAKDLQSLVTLLVALCLLCGCSTTSHLPEGELLYTGIDRIETHCLDSAIETEAYDAMQSALEVVPNSPLLGSAYRQSPLPVGLWIYNGWFTERQHGLRYWLWSHFKSDPILLSQVNPVLRCRTAEIAIKDEGYFDVRVHCDTILHRRNPRKAKLRYQVEYGRAARVASVEWLPTKDARVDSILAHTREQSLVSEGSRFCACLLEEEQARIGKTMSDSGYYAYDAGMVHFLVDTVSGGRQQTRVRIKADYEAEARHLSPYRIDSITSRPAELLEKYVSFEKGQLYSEKQLQQMSARLSRLNIFKYNNVEFRPIEDTSALHSSTMPDTIPLLMRITASYAERWESALAFDLKYKDNSQVGPSLNFQVLRRNLFGGGELLTGDLTAGYEWPTGHRAVKSHSGLLNSYEFGYKTTLTIPRLQLPVHFDDGFPAKTAYGLSFDIMRRSGFFQMMRSSAEVSYWFSTSERSTHIFTPLKLTYSAITDQTAEFDSIISCNPVLRQSFVNQFIPTLRYTYQYDNSARRSSGSSSSQWLQLQVVEAGALCDGLTGWLGHREQGSRKLFGQPFSQFVKASVDFRNYWYLPNRQVVASRVIGGIAYAYGNATAIPYSEQFFLGGANSLRGFSIRSIGPGRFHPSNSRYGYLDQTGDVKLEANLEWRFPLSGDLEGALFADAGNIWTLRDEASRPNGQWESSNLLRQLATDVGAGLRYNLGMLVIRFDIGVPLHTPDNDKSGYYNISGAFFGNLGYHLAIGYPF